MVDSAAVRRWLARPVCGAAALLALAACGPDRDGGYEVVSYRDYEELPAPVNPAPPRVTSTILAAASGGGGQVVAASLPSGVTQAMVDEGQQLFGTVCVACHASGGAGSAVAPALNDNDWLWIPDGEVGGLVTLITNGVPAPKEHPGAMPPMGGGNFSPDQVRALAAYVYALSHQAPS